MSHLSEICVVFLQNHGIPPLIIVFLISLMPLFELRMGLIAAAILQIDPLQAVLVCFIANILPIPFILMFIKQIFAFCKKHGIFPKIINALEKRALRRSNSVESKEFWGLFLFVAVPLPGTGAWTGALIAALLELPMKKSILAISLGVMGAGAIIFTLSYILPTLLH